MTHQTLDTITSEEAYKMSQSEFKGATIQALQDIRNDIQELKSYNRDSRIVSSLLGIASGIIASLTGISFRPKV